MPRMRFHSQRRVGTATGRQTSQYIVFQVLSHTLGIKPEVWRILDKCHGIRNLFEYDGSFDIDSQLLTDLVKATELVGLAVDALGPVVQSKAKGK